MTASLTIAGRRVAADAPVFAIAEIGLNHGGDVKRALAMVDAAARAGASAVKLQTLVADRLVAASCPAPAHVSATSLVEFFSRFELDGEAHRLVGARAHALGLAFLSTPFDEAAVAMLQDAGCDALKIASGDATHHRLIATAARTGLPLIVSTGMCSMDDVRAALECAREHGAREVAVLHCVSAYPTPAASANLGAIATLAREFGVTVGLSDHGTDPLAPALAVALGAAIYERHFVIAGRDEAIDRAVSSTADEFADVVRVAARVRGLLGDGRKRCLPIEAANLTPSRRGVYASRDLAAGAVLGEGDVQMLRPLTDLPARRWREVIGRRLRTPLAAGAAIPATALDPPLGQ
jgi:sialic acid synthase SpsE